MLVFLLIVLLGLFTAKTLILITGLVKIKTHRRP